MEEIKSQAIAKIIDDPEEANQKEIEGLESEVNELIAHIQNMLKDDVSTEFEQQEERLLNGQDLMVYQRCACSSVKDDVFHSFFRKIDWSLTDFKHLNKVQDRWSVYCQNQEGKPMSSL